VGSVARTCERSGLGALRRQEAGQNSPGGAGRPPLFLELPGATVRWPEDASFLLLVIYYWPEVCLL
jgi:hypothetical protein